MHLEQICADLLYDPVTFLDCLHTNCGACAKSWFASLNNIDAAKFTCPICRAEVRRTKHNSILQSLVADFIDKNPDKDRTPEEKATLRKLHVPGGGVLPGEANTSAGSTPSSPVHRYTPRPTPHTRQSAPSTIGSRASSGPRSPQRTINPRVSCSHCQKRVDYTTRYRCSECDVITCRQCYRLDKGCSSPSTGHIQTMERMQLEPNRHIQSGIFCDICDTWCDSSRLGEEVNSYFWACLVCNNGEWDMCLECVSRGNCCSHELQLFTNNRAAARNDTASRSALSLAERLRGLNMSTTRDARLASLGYTRWTNFNVTCDDCKFPIPHEHSYLHCTVCRNGQWDICMKCWEASPEVSGEEDGTVFKCEAGHKMLLLSQLGKEGTHKLIFDVPHDPPDYVSKRPSKGRNGPTVARDAVAVKSHWPDLQDTVDGAVYRASTPGERSCDLGGLLAFPQKAVISDVWVAFTEGEGDQMMEYLWGWYAGIGGLFPRDCVRFTS